MEGQWMTFDYAPLGGMRESVVDRVAMREEMPLALRLKLKPIHPSQAPLELPKPETVH